ncbi:hypothetical protein [Bacillus mesophilum]|uniref:Uncharacterized protein n=1 Tax=Bacillus mesophilum TaxID=1071718 RepID=A0A7V7RM76_9BACI|nr:hypothetical protein [Bacillus mesophilum]KAB2332934.1 hypothetical protein F7732_12700 [Bacillus mesophilum]
MRNIEQALAEIVAIGRFLEQGAKEQTKSPRQLFAEAHERALVVDKALSQYQHPKISAVRKAFKKVIYAMVVGKQGRFRRAQRMANMALKEVIEVLR